MMSAVVDRMLKIDKIKEEHQRNVAEKEDKAIVDDKIEGICNCSKKTRSGNANGIRFNARTMRIALHRFTVSPKGRKDFSSQMLLFFQE